MSNNETKDRILDTAEMLFSQEGYPGTSLRTLTARAGVNLAAVNYHFGSKEALLEAVFDRRLLPLNESRLKELERVREEARARRLLPDLEDILQAFMGPLFDFCSSGPGPRAFITLIGRTMAEPDNFVRTIFMKHMQPVLHAFFEALCESLPRISRDELYWRLQMSIGAMSRTMCMEGTLFLLPEGVEPPRGRRDMLRRLIPFVAAGMNAP